MSDSLDLDAIEARAQAATPGPWREDGPWWYDAEDGKVRASSLVTADLSRTAVAIPPTAIGDDAKFNADMAHIAGMDPATTLAMVSRLREAETQLANVRDRAERGLADDGRNAGWAALEDILTDLEELPTPDEVPARRRGRPGETEPDTRGYMGGV